VAHHPIVFFDFPATDPKAASTFYAEVFGWKITIDPSVGYHMFQTGGGPGGGFTKTGKSFAPFAIEIGKPLVYIRTDDIEATLDTITAQGGKTLQPKTEFPGGAFAYFADPAGNIVGLHTITGQ
jgi:predicted enzyme related to lactoylglutathione lyase